MTFQKVRFTSQRNGATAGLVLESAKLAAHNVESLSRLFPMSEAGKMERIEVSPQYDSWDAAFNHDFSATN